MSRSFVAPSSQFLVNDSAPVTAPPFTLACWFNSDSSTADQTLMFLGDKDSSQQYHQLVLNLVTASRIMAQSRAVSVIENAETTANYSLNVWNHACGVWGGTASRDAYWNAGSSANNAVTVNVAGVDRVAVGYLGRSGPTFYMSGRIAVPCVWNVALTVEEIAELAAGAWPYMIRPESVVGFWPLWGDDSPEIDLTGARQLTVTGATKSDTGPPTRIMSRFLRGSYRDVSGGGGGGNRRRRVLLGTT